MMPGTATAVKPEPSVTERQSILLDLDDAGRTALRAIVADELRQLREDPS